MKDIIRMNQLAGIITEGQAEKMMAILNENDPVQDKIQQYMNNGGKGDLDLNNLPITSLPNNLKVRGTLNLANTSITTLPDDLWVGVDLNLINTKITSLPEGLTVGGYLYLLETPIIKKYTKDEIRKMVPGVRRGIIMEI